MLIIVCALLIPAIALGQSKVGQAGAQFLEIGISARAVAMGDAFGAIADDATAVYYNPAGLTQLDRKEAVLTHIAYLADINYEFAGFALPLYDFGGTIGFAVYSLDAGDMLETTYENSLGTTGRTFSATDMAASVSYARSLTDHFSIGATWKFIQERYAEESAIGWAADVGTTYNTGYRGIKMSMVISNFGPELKLISENYPLPINFRFGGSIDVLDGVRHRATFSAEGAHPSDNYESYTMGMEYTFDQRYSLRIGQKFQTDTASGIALGGGMRLPISDYTFGVDYAFRDYNLLRNAHMFTAVFTF
jgi:long-subunit fatty acid transport protein